MTSDRAAVWWAAGVSSRAARVGTSTAPTARVSRVTSMRGASGSEPLVPCLAPPLRKATPSTSSTLASTEPTRAAWTTDVSPSRKANMATNSSGRLPRLDCNRPVGARAEVLADLLDRLADHRGQSGDSQGGDDETGDVGGAGQRSSARPPAVKTTALTMARRCEVPRASKVRGMSSTCADVTAAARSDVVQ